MPGELATFRRKISLHANAIGLLLHTVQWYALLFLVQSRIATLIQRLTVTMMSHHKAQGDHYEIHTDKLHAVLTMLQVLDRRLGLVGQARTGNESSHEQVIEDLEGTKYVRRYSGI